MSVRQSQLIQRLRSFLHPAAKRPETFGQVQVACSASTNKADQCPDLLCVGAQKAATTWLDAAFRQHHGFFLPPVKEIHYFSELFDSSVADYAADHRREQMLRVVQHCANLGSDVTENDLRWLKEALHVAEPNTGEFWYRQIFEHAESWQCRADVCPSYFNLSDAGIDHAFDVNPHLKVLAIARDPVDRTWSSLRMLLSFGQISVAPEDMTIGCKGVPWELVLDYSNYARNLPRWRAKTDQNAFKLVSYEKVTSAPKPFLDELCSWVGVEGPSGSYEAPSPVFEGEKMQFPTELRAQLYSTLSDQYDFLAKEMPEEVALWRERHEGSLK